MRNQPQSPNQQSQELKKLLNKPQFQDEFIHYSITYPLR